MLEKSVI